MRLETLSGNGDELPRSLRLDPHEHKHEQFVRRALLSLEYETFPAYTTRKSCRKASPRNPCPTAR